MTAAIRARGLVKRYGARAALAGLDLEVPEGCCFALFGANGSGKTTLVRLVATLIRASAGELEVLGERLPAGATAVRSRLGALLDQPLLPWELSLGEGLRLHADLHGVPSPAARVEEVASRMGLFWRLRDPVRSLSRGMAQRAAVARAILHDPELLLLDEPFNGLDPEGCGAVEAVVKALVGRGGTVLLVTHDRARGARLADRSALLRDGALAAEDAPTLEAVQ